MSTVSGKEQYLQQLEQILHGVAINKAKVSEDGRLGFLGYLGMLI